MVLTCAGYSGAAFGGLHHAKDNRTEGAMMRGLSLQIGRLGERDARRHTHRGDQLAVRDALWMHIVGGHHALALYVNLTAFLQSNVDIELFALSFSATV